MLSVAPRLVLTNTAVSAQLRLARLLTDIGSLSRSARLKLLS